MKECQKPTLFLIAKFLQNNKNQHSYCIINYKGGGTMSMLSNRVEKSKIEREQSIEFSKDEFASGRLPNGFSAIEIETGKNANLLKPKDLDKIKSDKGQPIATYQKSIDKWVLEKDISPDSIPAIGNKETISHEQFHYMSIHAQYHAYSNPGPAFIQAQSNARNGFGDDRLMDEAYFAGQTKKSAELAHRRLPKEIKDILEKHSESYLPSELQDIAMKTGTYANKFRQDGNVRISTGDVMSLMYKNIHRIPELESNRDTQLLTNNRNDIGMDDR
jgi:hypothetical protein